MKLIIGNRAYSSWSFRGWLACKQSGLEFEELVVPMFDEHWEKRREGDEFAPSLGKVPILWDGDCVVWDSLAIIEFLADRVGREKFWPEDESARGMARSMAAEMHSGFSNLRRELPMNVRRNFGSVELKPEVEAEIVRVLNLWAARGSAAAAIICSGRGAPRTSCSRRWSPASSLTGSRSRRSPPPTWKPSSTAATLSSGSSWRRTSRG